MLEELSLLNKYRYFKKISNNVAQTVHWGHKIRRYRKQTYSPYFILCCFTSKQELGLLQNLLLLHYLTAIGFTPGGSSTHKQYTEYRERNIHNNYKEKNNYKKIK
jgi:hypothetical protein